MSVSWNCDLCGKQTQVNPPTEFEVDENKAYVVSSMRQQNIFTGDIEQIKTYKMKYLSPKAHIVKLHLGDESVQRDFCSDCLQTIYPKLNEVFELLSSIKSK